MPKEDPTSTKKSHKKERKKLKTVYNTNEQPGEERHPIKAQPEGLKQAVEAAVGPAELVHQGAEACPATLPSNAAEAFKYVLT